MRVLFVYPNRSGHEYIHHGLAILSAVIKQQGHRTALVDCTWAKERNHVLKTAYAYKPDVIAITATSGQFDYAVSLADRLKSALHVPIIAGGIHATVAPEDAIAPDSIDMICRGEGEAPLVELLNRLENKADYTDIQNLWIKKNNTIHKNSVRYFVKNPDELPLPDFELFDINKYTAIKNGMFDVITSRGCVFDCSYCSNQCMREISGLRGKRTHRQYSVEYCIAMLRFIRDRYRVRAFSFGDDLFTFNKNWIRRFAVQYNQQFPGIPFACNHRVDLGSGLFPYLKMAGCTTIHMGVETGDAWLRKNILNRNISDAKIIATFRAAKEAGLGTVSFNMLGIPFEKEEHMQKTVALNRTIQPDQINVTIFCPYPGTQLYTLCREKGLLPAVYKIPSHQKAEPVLLYADGYRERIILYKQRFRYYVYRDSNWLKAVLLLFFDRYYNQFIAIRGSISPLLKRVMFIVYYRITRVTR